MIFIGGYSPNSFPAIGVLAGLVEGLVLGPGCRAAAGRTAGGRVTPHFCCYLHDLVTLTFKTLSLFDVFLLELHLSSEVLQ